MLKIALGQMEVHAGRPDLNTAQILSMIKEARDKKTDIIVFPEMSIPGHLLGDTWQQQAFLRDCEAFGQKIIAASQDICVIFGNVSIDRERHGGYSRAHRHNACFIAQNGRLAATRRKILQPNYRHFDDMQHFSNPQQPARELGQHSLLTPVKISIRDREYSLYCLIGEDGWDENGRINPIYTLQANGPADLLVTIASSPFTLGQNTKRNKIFSQQAQRTGIPLVYVNHVGQQNDGKAVYSFDGCSTVYNGAGQVIAYCQPFTATLQHLTLRVSNSGHDGAQISVPDDSAVSSLYQAVSYGTKQFLKAIGMTKVVIGLSGGIDSAVAAALYASILKPDNILLVNMPSQFNSQTTKDLAEQLAHNLGCLYTVMPIEHAIGHTKEQISSTPIANLTTGAQHNLTVSSFVLENIQARDRSARLLAGIAAAFGGGFTCNGNKSELTVGYSTLYGDQAGFFAALADLWKYQVYQLANYLNTAVYGREVIPQAVIDLMPSAELSYDQAVDEGKGDPLFYPYHDYLFRAFMEYGNRATPEDILLWYSQGDDILEQRLGCEAGLVNKLFPGPRQFIDDLERWWHQYTGMGVAKRIQAPPVLAINCRANGFCHREAQNSVYFTQQYLKVKNRLLSDL